MRRCRRCGEERPLDRFEEYRPGYHRWVCRVCTGVRRRERERENPDLRARDQARQRRRSRTHAERLRLAALRRRPDQRARKRAWQRRNRDRVNAANRAWRAANRDRHREASARSMRARRLRYDSDAVAYTELARRDPCSYCDDVGGEADHIEPTAQGGGNDWGNFTGACRTCNSAKNDVPLLAFMLSRIPRV